MLAYLESVHIIMTFSSTTVFKWAFSKTYVLRWLGICVHRWCRSSSTCVHYWGEFCAHVWLLWQWYWSTERHCGQWWCIVYIYSSSKSCACVHSNWHSLGILLDHLRCKILYDQAVPFVTTDSIAVYSHTTIFLTDYVQSNPNVSYLAFVLSFIAKPIIINTLIIIVEMIIICTIKLKKHLQCERC